MYPVLISIGDTKINSAVRSIVFPFSQMMRAVCVHTATVALSGSKAD